MSERPPTETRAWASAQQLSASRFRMLAWDVWQECTSEHNWNCIRGTCSSIFLSTPVVVCLQTPAGSVCVVTLILALHKNERIIFPLICLVSCSFHGGRVNKAWLRATFLRLSTDTPGDIQTVTACLFSWQENGQRGERGGVEMLSLCFLWPLPDCTYCCRAGWKGKGFTAEKSCSWIGLCGSQAPDKC